MTNSTEAVGWVPSNSDRGSLDIIWSCTLTIALCVWVSTHPNTPSRTDKWYHEIIDKFNLACIGLLGPDYLWALAGGQLMNARRSVKKFKASPELRNGQEWTLRHAFFADMGGFVLTSPDYPDGFPINADQLYYLVKHKHVEFPSLKKEEIDHRDKSDGLTKIITLCQVMFFLFTEFWRIGKGYPITTLELTTITFCAVMLGTSICWYFKPIISAATLITTRENRTVKAIRAAARASTHPGLPTTWYRTPLDFLSGEKFHFYRHWAYYTDLTYKLHVPVFSREIKVKPWDRIPGDIWFPPEFTWPDSLSIPLGLLLQIPFCVSFLGAWDFHFPSQAEKVLWRVCAVYHAVYTLCGITYYLFVSFRDRKILGTWIAPTPSQTAIEMTSRSNTPLPPGSETSPTTNRNRDLEDGHPLVSHQVLHRGSFQQLMAKLKASAISLRNLSHDQNPDMAIPLRWTGAFAVPSVLYIFCRLYFYAEDIISLRNQPADVYKSVERVLPFI